MLMNKEGLMEVIKVKGSLSCSDHEIMEIKIVRGENRAKSKITLPVFRKTLSFSVICWCHLVQPPVKSGSPNVVYPDRLSRGHDKLERSLPNSTILWFCDSAIGSSLILVMQGRLFPHVKHLGKHNNTDVIWISDTLSHAVKIVVQIKHEFVISSILWSPQILKSFQSSLPPQLPLQIYLKEMLNILH